MGPDAEPVHWDEVEGSILASRVTGPSRLLAVWPARVNADACFERAGFRRWSDGAPEAEEGFRRLVVRLVRHFETAGPAVLREGELPRPHRGFWASLWPFPAPGAGISERPDASDALIAAGEDDRFPPCVVTFGGPPRAALKTADGHNLLWVRATSGFDLGGILQAAGEGGPTVRLTLDWKLLGNSGGAGHAPGEAP